MESRCVARYLRVTPRKMRLVADIVRGLNVNDAIGLLKFTPRAGARPILKAIQSAVANIVNRDDAREVNPDTLVIKTILVDEGPSFRRFMPRAMGRATPIRKRMSHVTVTVGAPEPEEAEAEAIPDEEAAAPPVKETKKAAAKPAPKKKAPASRGTTKPTVKKKRTD
ncbi:MAG: 50S ribosomal protein L22 [bacterium]|nr:50S ribosomal protein L22 [bacterium]